MGATRKQNKNKHKALRFQFYLDPWNIILERESLIIYNYLAGIKVHICQFEVQNKQINKQK